MNDYAELQHANRRPIRSRDTGWAVACAAWLTSRGVKPNHVSLMSIVCTLLSAVSLLFAPRANGPTIGAILYLVVVVGIILRLLCNLFDGMIAVEGGLSSPVGELYNDIPDRFADALIFVACGYAAKTQLAWGDILGWAAALTSVLLAYVRLLGAACGSGNFFLGPMAKQHRMAVMNIAAIACTIGVFFDADGWILVAALGVVLVGGVVTFVRRVKAIAAKLWEQA